MSPPNGVRGPEPLQIENVDELNRLFSEAFTERYHRDGLSGVRVPQLNPAIWRYAIAAASDGALQWRDHAGALVAFNLVHASGAEGWMGPLAVRPDRQGQGLGRTVVTAGIRHLEGRGCRVIGLETMPRTVDNIGFYSRLGFRPGHLTVSMVREIARGHPPRPVDPGSTLLAREPWLERGRALVTGLMPGLDFEREMSLTLDQALGDLTVVRKGPLWRGFALWHSAPLAAGRPVEELRILKLVAVDRAAFQAVIDATLAEAAARGLGRVSVRCQTAFGTAFADLLERGFRVHWTDLRMVLGGKAEPPAGEAVVFSNWEI